MRLLWQQQTSVCQPQKGREKGLGGECYPRPKEC